MPLHASAGGVFGAPVSGAPRRRERAMQSRSSEPEARRDARFRGGRTRRLRARGAARGGDDRDEASAERNAGDDEERRAHVAERLRVREIVVELPPALLVDALVLEIALAGD